MKQVFLKYGKILFTFLILSYVLRNADLHSILRTIRNSDHTLILLALLTFSFYQILYSFNWSRVLTALSGGISYLELLRIHMIGLFYNLFLPTSMGGDVAKIYYLSKKVNDRVVAIKSIALLRGTGLLTNLLMLAVVLVYNREILALIGFEDRIAHGLYLLAGVIAGVSILRWTPARNNSLVQFLTGKVLEYISSFKLFLCDFRREMLGIFLLSLVNQLIIVFENYLILRALDIDIAFVNVMYIIPLTFFATMLPITIAGIGIREGAFVYFLTRHGYSVEDAIAFSLIGYVLILFIGFAGGVVSAISSNK
jgi:uncharacterized protein (TIRG00374 family)